MPYKNQEDAKRWRQEHKEELRLKQLVRAQLPSVKEGRRAYRQEHKEELRVKHALYVKNYRLTHFEFTQYELDYNKAYKQRLRKKVIAHFGGRCVRCGYSDWRALQIDHIYGGGTREIAERNSALSYHRKLLKEIPGVTYQLLCSNCNWIKRYERSEVSGEYLQQVNSERKFQRALLKLEKEAV